MAFTGTIAIRGMKAGDFQATIYAGTQAGLQTALNECEKISIGPGTLTVTSGFTVGHTVHVQGCGKGRTTIVGTAGITCFAAANNFECSDLTLDTWGTGIDFSSAIGTIDKITIRNVEIKNHNRGIYANNLTPGIGVDQFHAEDCTVTTGTSYGIFVNTYVIGRSTVQNCTVKTFFDRGISFGNNTVALEDIRGPYIIQGNHVEDGLNASASAVEGIICHGWRAVITDNEVRNIRRTNPLDSDCEGIYTKCRYSVIANNLLVDAGQNEAFINLKGGARNETVVQPYGFSVICANNQMVDTQVNPTSAGGAKVTSGIKIATSECLVIGNEISGMTSAGIYDDSDNGSDTPNHNILVTNNIVKDSRGAYGIALFGRGNNVRVVDNLVDTVLRTFVPSGQSYGIYMAKKAGTGLDVVSNRVKNIVDYGQTPVGIYMSPSRLNITVTADPATETFSTTFAHTFLVNDQIKFSTTGTLPAPLVAGTIYYIKTVPTSLTFTISATLGGATLDITTAGTPTNTANKMTTHTNWVVNDNAIDTATYGVQFTWDETYSDVDGCFVRHNTGRNLNGNVIPAGADLLKYSDTPTNLISWPAQNETVTRTGTGDSDIKSGTIAQALHVYGTYTDASNYERLTLESTASASRTLQESLGTGVARPYEFGSNGNKWRITASGHVEPMTDAAFDIGSTSFRPRGIYVGSGGAKITRLDAGTYTPTATATSNCSAPTMTVAQYVQVGGTCTVSGRFTTTATVGGAASFEISLPVASNFILVEQASGTAVNGTLLGGDPADIIGVTANDTAKIRWFAGATSSQTWSYHFTYQVR